MAMDLVDNSPLVQRLSSQDMVAADAEPFLSPPLSDLADPSHLDKTGILDILQSSAPFFAVEVDGENFRASATKFDNFTSLLQYVTLKVASRALPTVLSHATSSEPLLEDVKPPPSSNWKMLEKMAHCAGEMGEADPLVTVQPTAMVSEVPEQHGQRSVTWVSLRTTDAQEINQLGQLCGLHSLTIEDVITDSYEKIELYPRRGYLYCMVDAQNYSNSARLHVLLFHDWVFTIHDNESAAIFLALGRLQEELVGIGAAQAFTLPSVVTAPRYTGSPAWVLYNLLDVVVDWIIPASQQLLQEAEEMDQLVFITSSEEQPDVLRRISFARSRIHGLKQHTFAKQRLLMVASSASTEPLIPPQVKLYMRDVCDHIVWCAQQLNSADEILVQANNNYLACVSIEAARMSNKTNSLMKHLGFLATIFVPFTLIAGLMGMNVPVPLQHVDNTGPFWGIVTFFCLFCMVCYGTFYHMDQRRRKRHVR